MPTLYIEPDDGKIKSATLGAAGVLAVAVVQVWSGDAEVYYGTVLYPATEEACIALKQSYEQRGLDAGIAVGRAQLQRELKGLLGVGQ